MSVLGALKQINRKLGNPARAFGTLREAIEPRLRMRKFEKDRRARETRYAGSALTYAPQPDIVAQIERDGFAIMPQAFDPAVLLRVRAEMEAHLDRGTSLVPITKDSARTAGDLKAAKAFFSPEETRLGQEYFRRHTNYVSIADPLVHCPTVAAAAFYPLLADVAWSYLGCVPAVGGLNLRKSYVNDLPEFDTLYFHVDPNSPKFLKFFFYLNDVDINGGPFCYVRGTHRSRHRGWKSKGRWTTEEMAAAYGADSIQFLTANVGDILVADTNGFHRGTKLLSNDRSMLTVDYVVHEEFEGTQSADLFRIPRQQLEGFAPRERALADFLKPV